MCPALCLDVPGPSRVDSGAPLANDWYGLWFKKTWNDGDLGKLWWVQISQHTDAHVPDAFNLCSNKSINMPGTRYWIRVTPPTLKAYTCKVVVYSHHPAEGFRGLLKPPIVGGYLGRPFGVPWRSVDFLCGHLGAFCRLRSLTGGRVVSNVNPAGGRHRGSRRFLGMPRQCQIKEFAGLFHVHPGSFKKRKALFT